jgi:ABC-type nitrate/sulfonate/bicarbonate transport system substrate-binding protein
MLYALVIAAAPLFSEELRILVPKSTSSIPFFEIEDRDAKHDALPGIEISVEVFANHVQALARLLSGDVDMLFTGSSVGWSNHLNGGPMIQIGTGVWAVSSILGKDQAYQDLGDLRGKTVAVPFPGAPLDLQLRYMLKENGIDPDNDLEFVYSTFPQTAGQILSGQIDAAPLPEPLATSLVVGKGLVRYVRLQDAWAEVSGGDPLSPQVSLFGIPESVDVFSVNLPGLLDLWKTISIQVTGNAEAYAEKYSESLGQPSALVNQAISNTIYLVPAGAETKTRTKKYIQLVGVEGEDAVPSDNFFYLP